MLMHWSINRSVMNQAVAIVGRPLSRLTKAVCCAHVLSVFAALYVRAEGGPPMLTDDPATPGNGNFELNIAATVEGSHQQQSWELPNFDLNYGVGKNIQLNLETSFNVLKHAGQGPIGGPGSASAAVKWRFLDQKRVGLDLSIYPRFEWNLVPSSARRGLTEEGIRFFLPVEIARSLEPIDLDLEAGPLIRSVGRSEWNYGVVIGTAATSTLDLMAELHGTARTSFAHDRLTVNVGLRKELKKAVALIGSIGHDVRAAPGESLSLVSYLGLQLEF
jgi:hypothetical protein